MYNVTVILSIKMRSVRGSLKTLKFWNTADDELLELQSLNLF